MLRLNTDPYDPRDPRFDDDYPSALGTPRSRVEAARFTQQQEVASYMGAVAILEPTTAESQE